MNFETANIVNFDRYPIVDLQSPQAQDIVGLCRAQLAERGLCLLPEFILESALMQLQNEASRLVPKSHYTEHWRATPNGAGASSTSTLGVATRASMRSIATDQLDTFSPLKAIYSWPGFVAFINAVLDGPKLYATQDPIVGCMMTVLNDGDELGWHYDPNDGVVSLLITQPEAGGDFEFAPGIRAPRPNAADNEMAVIDGCYQPVVRVALKPGTLSLFNGHRSLHRVAPVTGQAPRIIALFNYANEPHYQFSDQIRQRFFGRVSPLGELSSTTADTP